MDEIPGGPHLALGADVADPQLANDLVETLIDEWGHIDILINNAGVYIPHPIQGTSFQDWQQAWQDTFAVNLNAAANLSFLVAQQMIQKQIPGAIINVSSRGAFRGEPNHPGLCGK